MARPARRHRHRETFRCRRRRPRPSEWRSFLVGAASTSNPQNPRPSVNKRRITSVFPIQGRQATGRYGARTWSVSSPGANFSAARQGPQRQHAGSVHPPAGGAWSVRCRRKGPARSITKVMGDSYVREMQIRHALDGAVQRVGKMTPEQKTAFSIALDTGTYSHLPPDVRNIAQSVKEQTRQATAGR